MTSSETVSADAVTDSQLDEPELTVDELASRVGVPVRTIRFWAGKRLLPPPRLAGRTGLYGPAHVARLVLIRDLQQAGYTLAAIEQFLATLPLDADATDVELFGTLLTPWVPEEDLVLDRDELARRVDHPVDDELLDMLARANVVQREGADAVRVTPSHVEFAHRLLELDAPIDALLDAATVIQRHAGSLAGELQQIFRERIRSAVDESSSRDRERLRTLAAGLRPLTIQAIVAAYQEALDREVRRAGSAPTTPGDRSA